MSAKYMPTAGNVLRGVGLLPLLTRHEKPMYCFRSSVFYRAMPCIVGTMLSEDVCPSVLHTPVICQNISNFFITEIATPF